MRVMEGRSQSVTERGDRGDFTVLSTVSYGGGEATRGGAVCTPVDFLLLLLMPSMIALRFAISLSLMRRRASHSITLACRCLFCASRRPLSARSCS
jgi:hypothetical protein